MAFYKLPPTVGWTCSYCSELILSTISPTVNWLGGVCRGTGLVVAVDMFVNDSSALAADLVLAAAGPTESEGTFTNLEGRVTSMGHKVTPPGTARPAWVIADGVGVQAGTRQKRRPRPSILPALSGRNWRKHQRPTACSPEEALSADPLDGVLLNGALLDAAEKPAVGSDPTPTANPATADPGTDPQPAVKPLEGQSSSVSDARALRLVAARTMYDDGVAQRHCAALRSLGTAS